MFRPFVRGLGLASSPQARRLIRGAVAVARSEEARDVAVRARKIAASPEGRRLAAEAVRAASHLSRTLAAPEGRDRVRAAARLIGEHRR